MTNGNNKNGGIDIIALSGAISVASLILSAAAGVIGPIAAKQQLEQTVAAEVRKQTVNQHHQPKN